MKTIMSILEKSALIKFTGSLLYECGSTCLHFRTSILTCLFVCLIGFSQTSQAALNLPTVPLFIADSNVQPNIFFGLDDSGSMDWEVVIEGTGNATLFLTHSDLGTSTGHFYLFPVADRNLDPFGSRDRTMPSIEFFERCAAEGRAEYSNAGNFSSAVDGKTACADELTVAWRAYNNNFNGLYYNPEVTYTPWKGNDTSGTAYGPADPTAARADPFNPSLGTVDLTATLPDYVSWWNGRQWNDSPGWEDRIDGFRPSFYYVWGDTNGDGVVDPTPTDTAIRVDIVPATPTYNNDGAGTDRSARVDCAAAPACTYAEEIQNFANWFQYFRKREFVMKKAVSELVDSSSARIGMSTLHTLTNNSVARPITSMTGIGDLASGVSNKTELLKQLSRINSSGGTPNRILLADIGRYFDKSNTTNSNIGFTDSSPILDAIEGGECQQNFTLLMSDGFWNGGSRSFGNEDGDDDTLWDGGPHADNASDTLADAAMFYYENDLAPALDNKVPEIEVGGIVVDSNPAQHMVTYTVAFGITGNNLTTPPDHDPSTPPPPWPSSVNADSAETLDDMQHAAFNGRGLFLNAQKSDELITSLQNAFADIEARTDVSGTAVAINSTVLRTSSRVYQARFSTVDWSGEVSAFTLNPDATLDQEVWKATERLPAAGSRTIITTIDKAGTPTPVPFTDADADLVTAVGSANLINYIRGDQSNEQQNGGTLRNRNVLLGDVVNSSPIAVSTQNFGYDVLPAPEGTDYGAFLANKTTTFTGANGELFNMVYMGGNDGMLHAYQDTQDTNPAAAGQELFAYVPSAVHGNLSDLADPDYAHRFFVDATPHSSDAFIGGAWKTLLVGTLGNGGRQIYALDITNPLTFSTSDVMWEFDDTDNNELGFVMSTPTVARLNNGQWGVIFGNGYNSASQKAQLFILNAADGSVIKVIDTEVGSGASPNGLAQPFLLDENGDRTVDTVYAGDLQGNMWKFDVSNSNTAQWGIPFTTTGGGPPKPAPLYTALDDNDDPQPITTRPTVAIHPDGGFMVLFGTGKYIETTDTNIPASPQIQTFYGIRDIDAKVTGDRDAILQEQLILDELDVVDANGDVINTVRVVSDNAVDYATKKGWFIELESPINGAEAERVIANPITRFERIIFTTFIPRGPCEEGGSSVIMELDAVSGARLENSVFDLNNDGIIDASDFVDQSGTGVPGSGLFIPGTLANPAIISAEDASQEFKLTSGISGEITTTQESTGSIFVGRQSWRQLR